MYISSDKLFFQKAVESFSNPDETHLVVYGQNYFEEGSGLEQNLREWSCTCNDFQYRGKRSGKYCKHIAHVLNLPVEKGGFCDWSEDSGLEPIYLKNKDGNYQPYAPFKRENGEWVKAVYIPDDTTYDEFEVEGHKVIVLYFKTNLPEEAKAYLRSNKNMLELFVEKEQTKEETVTYVSDENLPPISVTRKVSEDNDFPTQGIVTPVKKRPNIGGG